MASHQLGRDRRDILGQLVLEMGGVGDMDLADSGDLRRRLRDGVDALAGDQQWTSPSFDAAVTAASVASFIMAPHARPEPASSCDDSQRLQLGDQLVDRADLVARLALGGLGDLEHFEPGAMSTPKSPGVFVASGFDLAFMMLGSEA